MRLLVASDLHFGFSARTSAIHESLRLRVLSRLDFDAVVIAGDLGTSRIHHLEAAARFLRRLAGERPVFVVLGNHDFWDRKVRRFAHLRERQRAIMARHAIICLQDRVDEILAGDAPAPLASLPGLAVIGYNGWYYALYPMTNDRVHIPEFGAYDGSNLALSKHSDLSAPVVAQLAREARDRGERVVVVTHFPIYNGDPSFKAEYGGNTRHFPLLNGVADVLLFGHSHHRLDVVTDKGTRVLNVGGDYERPRYIILEV